MRRRQLQPLRLAAVCKRWRQVATTASPRLWRYVDIDTTKNARNQPKISILHTTRVLTRSGSTLLNIRLVRPFPAVEQEDADLLSNIAGVMHRCRSFIFVGPLYDAAARLTNLLQTSTPRLEELLLNGLTASPANVQVHHVRGIRLFPDAPLLRSMVAVSSFGFRTEFPFITAAALHGSISSTEQDDIAYVLGNSPGLNELAICNPVFAVSARGQVVAPNVEVLTVTANQESPLHFLAQRYIFPGLKGLHLYGAYNGSNLRVRYLAAVATTSSLTHVTITDLLAADLGFACTVVNGLNFLESLMIIRSSFAAETLQALCDALTRVVPPKPRKNKQAATPGQWPCPCLFTLQLLQCKFDESCDPQGLLDMISARLDAARAAASAALKSEGPPEPALLQGVLIRDWSHPDHVDLQSEIDALLESAGDESGGAPTADADAEL
ncbi:hypothetical protein EXIGLDRAFT_272089 [Exidia glandulosa HHB12029]|uniref:F-box domain-containing protein n=1 Tax=Exidia glandulosa HHB12029 TaxID=1314781 RepID=A0A165DMH6_EXIGL|nr:hypothetical protein EXIGLDRAFT_272089 [Exidia glandulosa HHB12029]